MAKPAQEFVPVKEIRDGVVVLKNSALRQILMVSTVNFSLKSQDEQQSILYQFQNFLNSLDFPAQICIQSRELDIRPYINLLEERQKEQVNDLLKLQTREYIGFIKAFAEKTNVMSKRFYVIVPYTPTTINTGRGGVIDKVKGVFGLGSQDEDGGDEDSVTFNQQKSQLEERVSVVEQGLTRVGLRTARLGDEEVTELLYQTLNPGETDMPI